MAQLRFTQIIIISKENKSSNLFQFSPTKNLITADDNSCGKSTLIKSILWTFGCEPIFNDDWKSQNTSCLLNFEIDGKFHQIYRENNSIYYTSGNKKLQFSRITGDYAKFFGELVGFTPLLINRAGETATPPPAFYFLPFYINQDTGWIDTWNGFDNLAQFSSWKSDLVKFFAGYTTPEYFQLEEKIVQLKKGEEQSKDKIKQLNDIETIIQENSPSHNFSFDESEFTDIENELQQLDELLQQEAEWAKQLSKYNSNNYFLKNQSEYIEQAILSLEEDYLFATEYLENEVKCPTCGIFHNNSIFNRASILADKQKMIKEKSHLDNMIAQQQIEIQAINSKSKEIRDKIKYIHIKYQLQNESFDNYLIGMTPRLINKSFLKIKMQENNIIADNKKNQYELKNKKESIVKNRRKSIDGYFYEIMHQIKNDLNIHSLNLETVKTPLNYNKLSKSGGGSADKTRVILAYRLAIYKLIDHLQSTTIAPLLIDTPNQHEQDKSNYNSIINYLSEKINNNLQIFLCAMPNEILDNYKKSAHIIHLDKNKILSENDYTKHNQIINEFLNDFL